MVMRFIVSKSMITKTIFQIKFPETGTASLLQFLRIQMVLKFPETGSPVYFQIRTIQEKSSVVVLNLIQIKAEDKYSSIKINMTSYLEASIHLKETLCPVILKRVKTSVIRNLTPVIILRCIGNVYLMNQRLVAKLSSTNQMKLSRNMLMRS